MPYNLVFSSDFFFAEGEPYERQGLALNKNENPISLWSAICLALETDSWFRKTMANELEIEPEFLTPEICLDKAMEVNTCTTLNSPVEVWFDENGYITLCVHEENEEIEEK